MSRLPLLIVAGVIASVVVVNGRPGADPSGKDAMIPALAVVVVGMMAIIVARRRGGQKRWQHDLWLAERLADALAPRG